MRAAATHLRRQLILALAQVDDMSQQAIRRPFGLRNLKRPFQGAPNGPGSATTVNRTGYCVAAVLRAAFC